jgi:hypothetical protein
MKDGGVYWKQQYKRVVEKLVTSEQRVDALLGVLTAVCKDSSMPRALAKTAKLKVEEINPALLRTKPR